ncbi:MAG: hypothetical protein RI894_1216 [Bacteroidota bacterium]|jgi:hypothetical protein
MIDFFKIDCQQPSINQSLFGLCDDGLGAKAYTDLVDSNKWIDNELNLRFFRTYGFRIDLQATIIIV